MKRAALPLADDLTGLDYFMQSGERVHELFDKYAIPRPGEPSELRDRLESLTGGCLTEAESWRQLAFALAREYHPDCKPVFPAAAKPYFKRGWKPGFRPGRVPRFERGELLNIVAAYMAKTKQCETGALDDLFGEDADRPDATSRRRFYTIKKAHPKKWKAVLSSHTACG